MYFKKYLTDNVLPFWIDNAIDDKYGIFIENMLETTQSVAENNLKDVS